MSPQTSLQAKRFGLLMIVLCLLGISLVACSASDSPVAGSSDNSGINGFKTPNASLFTPTATFPPFTIGIWPSNYSPQNNDTVTIYVLCRTHQDMNNPPAPAAQLSIHVQVYDPINKGADGKTDDTGLAAIPISFSDPLSGRPVRVDATVTYGGKGYLATTYFTPAVTTAPTATVAPTATP